MKAMKCLAVIAAAAAILACKKEDPTNQSNNQNQGDNGGQEEYNETLTLSPYEVTFEGEGGTVKVVVTTSAEDYTVTGAADWLTVEKNGKELSLTAAANTVNAERKCDLTVTGKVLTSKLPVTQKAGSPYPGFTVCPEAKYEYSGTLLYQFLKPQEEDYGGQGYISMTDEEGSHLSIWVYTELFTSEEAVELNAGQYVKGQDAFPVLYGKKYTWAPGVLIEGDEEDDSYIMGSYIADFATGKEIPLTGGTVDVTANEDGTMVILVDMLDENGNTYKYVFTGEVAIDTEGATYPTDRVDVANTVFGAVCYYKGDVFENGTVQMALQLFSGPQDNPATTNFDFYIPAAEFAENLDISGNYATPDEEEGMTPHTAGTLDFGVMVDYGFFQYPSGAFIMYEFGDYLIADGYASLMLTKQDDGKYTLAAALMSIEGDMVMFMGADFTGLHDLEIPIIDASGTGDVD